MSNASDSPASNKGSSSNRKIGTANNPASANMRVVMEEEDPSLLSLKASSSSSPTRSAQFSMEPALEEEEMEEENRYEQDRYFCC